MKAKKVYETVNFERGKDPKDALKIGAKERLKDEAFSLQTGWTIGEVKSVSKLMGLPAADIYQLGFAGEWDYDKHEFNTWTKKLDRLTPISGAFKKDQVGKDGYYFFNLHIGKIVKSYLDEEGIYWWGDAAAAINLGLPNVPRDERESMK